ncbi:MAG: hypothetical protein ACE5JQ_03470 [Candidatus Methylomirabilales bacterium]
MCLSLAPTILPAHATDPQSLGLKVSPGALLIQNVFLGKLYDVYKESGIRLTIHNQSDTARTYVLSAHLPSDIGAQRWLEGYSEIPDLSWFWFDQQEITIKADGVGYVKMYFEIPKEERYYNQNWVLALGIKGKPEAGPTILLAAYPKIQIETESKEAVRARPDGPIGLEPSVIVIKNLPLGTKGQATLRLYNNDVDTRRYRLASKTFPLQTGELSPIPLSPGYEWIPEPKWIAPNSGRVRVGPKERAAVSLSIKIPKDQDHRGRKWESIVFVESEDGRTRFARVQIETEQ